MTVTNDELSAVIERVVFDWRNIREYEHAMLLSTLKDVATKSERMEERVLAAGIFAVGQSVADMLKGE